MTTIFEYMREKLYWEADQIVELLTGSSGYKVRAEKARIANVRQVVEARQAQRRQPSGDGDLVMIEIHPVVDGYSSDMCRMACVGTPTSEQEASHDLYV